MQKEIETEGDLETTILNHLVGNGIFAWRNNSTGVFDEASGTWRNGNAYAINGVSDILGILPNGQFLAIEVKHPIKRTKPSKAQSAFLGRINNSGGMAFVCDSFAYYVMKITPYVNS